MAAPFDQHASPPFHFGAQVHGQRLAGFCLVAACHGQKPRCAEQLSASFFLDEAGIGGVFCASFNAASKRSCASCGVKSSLLIFHNEPRLNACSMPAPLISSARASPASVQEEVVFGLSERLLGRQYLFYPMEYGHSREPADVAWVANRCAILMYMTASGGSYDKKVRHNLSQLHKWLRQWKAGQPLMGVHKGTPVEFKFDDIDHTIGISVIDGGEIWCENHHDQVQYANKFDGKLSVCATLTSRVVRKLALAGAAPRDFLNLISKLEFGVRYRESAVLDLARSEIMTAWTTPIIRLRPLPADLLRMSIGSVTAFQTLRMETVSEERTSAFACDLRLTDLAWLQLAHSAIQPFIAPPGTFGTLEAGCYHDAGDYVMACMAVADWPIISAGDSLAKFRSFAEGRSYIAQIVLPETSIILSMRLYDDSVVSREASAARARALSHRTNGATALHKTDRPSKL